METIVNGGVAVETTKAEKAVREVTEQDLANKSEQVRQAVAEGHIKASWDEVTISDKASPTGKGQKREYLRLDAQSAQGMAAIAGGKMKPADPRGEGEDKRTPEQRAPGACDFFNYGYDLDVRASVRQALMGDLEGPEKAVKTAVKGFLAAEFAHDDIRSMIANSPKFKGVEGLEKMVEAALKA
jgi:hypothetical protein